jgi:hypothetical protein
MPELARSTSGEVSDAVFNVISAFLADNNQRFSAHRSWVALELGRD